MIPKKGSPGELRSPQKQKYKDITDRLLRLKTRLQNREIAVCDYADAVAGALKQCVKPFFEFSKVDSMADERLDVLLHGVPSGATITIKALLTTDVGFRFSAFGQYRSDRNGNIDLSVNESLKGTYTGADSMGLFWSMRADSGQKKWLRFLPNVFKPSIIKFSAYFGWIECFDDVKPIVETSIKRKWMADDITYQHVRYGRIRGILFIPKVEGSAPAILDVYGSGGGLMPHRAALLASKGFVTFSLAIYRYDDLPKILSDIDLEYFLEAINYLKQLDFVDSARIGAIGLSKGADIMILVASLTADVKAVASINGLAVPFGCDFVWSGGRLTTHKFVWSNGIEEEDGSLSLRNICYMDDVTIADVYPVENIQGKILVFASADDRNVNAVEHGRLMLKRLEKFNMIDKMTLIELEGAGHILDPVYMPHCTHMNMKHVGNYVAAAGGSPSLHHLAQDRYWRTLVDFFKENLTKTKSDFLRHRL